MIHVTNISYSYSVNNHNKEKPILSNISFQINDGEFVSVLGKSGCGKTTLANIMAGYLTLKSGKVLINNLEVKKPGRNRVLVNQENDLFEWMTVLENMKLASGNMRNIKTYLKLVGLNKAVHHLPRTLSGGMKKRLSLARALVVNPNFLILDEPFASLDHKTKEELQLGLDKIFSFTKKTTLLVTHDIDEAIFLSDRIIILGGKPTSLVKNIIIDFPHPRRSDIKTTKKFSKLKDKIKISYS